ncbi:unnamed protein product [Vitrella brassicaformis CCMP3155]|uniref:Kinesin motor domain-containing protein n=1 Tax=Vitrella brassicaformis (strain CCMP3155) TaxID=1169540 RepID=A0A0G4F4A4_VITBC|nr:unnamed protein product [Vitrella brassicaformis CCMP3155]|eukprot:CEM07092.1 unnamed protein product [Vitrella brassicaformis CCMP3155]
MAPSTSTIKVAVRVRPLNQREKKLKDLNCIAISDDSTTLVVQHEGAPVDEGGGLPLLAVGGAAVSFGGDGENRFTFDHVLDESVEQHDVYDNLGAELIDNALGGYNATIFAYGQTSAGKSFTILGPPSNPGILPRVCKTLFERVEAQNEAFSRGDPSCTDECKVQASYLEIYNERLHDLLSPDKPASGPLAAAPPVLDIYSHPVFGVYIPELTEPAVKTYDDVDRLLQFGSKKRTVSATNLNAMSSRSHTVFTLTVQQIPRDRKKGVAKFARLHIIDLAGSERTEKSKTGGERQVEGSFINKSLTTLGMVISRLAEMQEQQERDSKTTGSPKRPSLAPGRPSLKRSKAVVNVGATSIHIPYRNSKLTYILSDSLGGNSRTCMIACISPALSNVSETLSTLRFATRVKKITNKPKLNVTESDKLVADLKSEIAQLRQQLEDAKKTTAIGGELPMLADMRNELRNRETLVNKLQAGDAEKEAADLASRQLHLLQELGLGPSGGGGVGVAFTSPFGDMPYLLNISDDPMLCGTLMYFIKPEAPGEDVDTTQGTTIGTAEDATIVLRGLGLHLMSCRIVNDANTRLTLIPEDAKVMVNGRVVPKGVRHLLRNHDRIVIGRAFVFRVIIPSAIAAAAESPTQVARRDDGSEEGEDAVDMSKVLSEILVDETAVSRAVEYANLLQDRIGFKKAQSFLERFKEIIALVDEANEITQEMRSEDRLSMTARVLSDPFDYSDDAPAIVVRLSRHSEEGMVEPVCMWDTVEFLSRLDLMRNAYHEYCEEGVWEKGPLESDPWMQVSLVELEASVADIKAKVWLEAEAAMKLFVEERRKEKTTQQREQLKRSSTITRASETSPTTAGRGRADDRKRHKGETAAGDTEGWSIQRFEQMVRSAQADMELTQMESNIKKAARSASVVVHSMEELPVPKSPQMQTFSPPAAASRRNIRSSTVQSAPPRPPISSPSTPFFPQTQPDDAAVDRRDTLDSLVSWEMVPRESVASWQVVPSPLRQSRADVPAIEPPDRLPSAAPPTGLPAAAVPTGVRRWTEHGVLAQKEGATPKTVRIGGVETADQTNQPDQAAAAGGGEQGRRTSFALMNIFTDQVQKALVDQKKKRQEVERRRSQLHISQELAQGTVVTRAAVGRSSSRPLRAVTDTESFVPGGPTTTEGEGRGGEDDQGAKTVVEAVGEVLGRLYDRTKTQDENMADRIKQVAAQLKDGSGHEVASTEPLPLSSILEKIFDKMLATAEEKEAVEESGRPAGVNVHVQTMEQQQLLVHLPTTLIQPSSLDLLLRSYHALITAARQICAELSTSEAELLSIASAIMADVQIFDQLLGRATPAAAAAAAAAAAGTEGDDAQAAVESCLNRIESIFNVLYEQTFIVSQLDRYLTEHSKRYDSSRALLDSCPADSPERTIADGDSGGHQPRESVLAQDTHHQPPHAAITQPALPPQAAGVSVRPPIVQPNSNHMTRPFPSGRPSMIRGHMMPAPLFSPPQLPSGYVRPVMMPAQRPALWAAGRGR